MTSVSTDRRQGVNSGAALKVPCRAASTGNLTLSGEQSIDGVACVTGDRVLVKNQTSGAQNGIYIVDTGTWGRAPDWDGAYDVVTGTAVYITSGTSNSGTYWAVTTTGTITVSTTSVAFTNAVISSAASISTIQSGTGALTRDSQSKQREKVSTADFCTDLTGATDMQAAFLKACNAAVAADSRELEIRGTILLASTLPLTSSHLGLRFTGTGTIKRGFNGTLITCTDTAYFQIDGPILDGNYGTYTGKGVVFSGSNSTSPVFTSRTKFTGFSDTHIEFGADAGRYARVECDFLPGSAQTNWRAVHVNGPDTNVMLRHITGVTMNEGYITLAGANNTYITGTAARRVEIDSSCTVTNVSNGTWSDGGTLTMSGSNSVIIGNRIAGDITLDANFTGSFVGNRQTSGTFTDSTSAGSALVFHINLATVTVHIGKTTLYAFPSSGRISYSKTASVGNADSTFAVGGAPVIIYSTSLTANRTVTLSTTGAVAGDRCTVSRSAGDTGGPWTVSVGGLKSLSTNQWCDVEYDGAAWVLIRYGTL